MVVLRTVAGVSLSGLVLLMIGKTCLSSDFIATPANLSSNQSPSETLDSKQSSPTTAPSVNSLAKAREAQPSESYAEAFYRGLAQLPILEQRHSSEGPVAFREDLLYKPDYRYPSLVRRYYEDGQGNYREGKTRFTEVQVANQFLVQMKWPRKKMLRPSDLPEALRARVDEIFQVGKQTLIAKFHFDKLHEREEIRQLLADLPEVSGVFNDSFSFLTGTANDEHLAKQWHLENDGVNYRQSPTVYEAGVDAKVAEAWDYATDCRNIPIAVLDTGVDFDHPDLQPNILMNEGRSFIAGLESFRDDHYHGTHVAGIIAAASNESGIAGVCWKAKIIPVKVMDSVGAGSYSEVVAALNYVTRSSARIANASLAMGPLPNAVLSPNEPIVVAIRELEKAGKILFAAAGNDAVSIDNVLYLPTKIESDAIIAVGSTTPSGILSPFSNFGTEVDISGPGSEILSTVPTSGIFPQASLVRDNGNPVSGYGYLSGTSMATPLVAGIAALFWSQVPLLPAKEVRRYLLEQSTISPVDLRIKGNLMVNAAKLLKGTEFEFDLIPQGEVGDLLPGKDLKFSLKIRKEGFFGLKKIELINRGERIAEVLAPETSFSFKVPSDPELSLIIRVQDTAGRYFDSNPFLMQAGAGSFDFQKLRLNSSGDVRCKVGLTANNNYVKIHEEAFDSAKSCKKFCDIIKPLLGAQSNSILCGP